MYLSRNDIEKISKDVVSEYMKLPKIRIKQDISKIDPYILTENLLGLKIDFQHLSTDKQTFGVTSYFNTLIQVYDDEGDATFYPLDGNTVLIEKDLALDPMEGKFTFTIGHEASHHILRKMFPSEYGPQILSADGARYYRYYDTPRKIMDWEEWQASALASAILMPEELLKKNMEKVGIGERLEVLNSRYRKEDFFKFCELAVMMGVSLTALRIRMKYLGLLKSDYYRNDRGIIEIQYEE